MHCLSFYVLILILGILFFLYVKILWTQPLFFSVLFGFFVRFKCFFIVTPFFFVFFYSSDISKVTFKRFERFQRFSKGSCSVEHSRLTPSFLSFWTSVFWVKYFFLIFFVSKTKKTFATKRVLSNFFLLFFILPEKKYLQLKVFFQIRSRQKYVFSDLEKRNLWLWL